MYKTSRKLVPDVFQKLFIEKINKYTLKSQGKRKTLQKIKINSVLYFIPWSPRVEQPT